VSGVITAASVPARARRRALWQPPGP
jgi:hypothetical protein